MLLYVDANCFNRPFDDQQQDRIREETEAVFRVLQRIVAGEDQLAWSPALTLELSAHPEAEIREQLLAWTEHAKTNAAITSAVRQRVAEFVAGGLKPLDATHAAFAEAEGCDILLTCDDRMLKGAQRLNLSLRVLNPVEYVMEIRNG